MYRYDVIVVGAGITGLASAYHIKKMNGSLKVAVLDKKGAFCQGNTAKSAAAFRNMFSSEVNRKITQSTIEFYRHVQNDLGIDLGMHFNGYLFLGEQKFIDNPTFREFVDEGIARYVSESTLNDNGMRTRLSEEEKEVMNLSNIDGGVLGTSCGILAPEKICEFYGNELAEMGVEFFLGTEVRPPKLQPVTPLNYPGEPFVWQKTSLNTVETNRGEFSAVDFIFCTDVWTNNLLDDMGIDGHTRGKKRQVFQISGPEVQKILEASLVEGQSVMPLTILPSHEIVLRPDPDSRSIWVTIADDYNRDFSIPEDPQPEPDFYEKSLFPVLTAYFPQLKDSKVSSMWAGHYAYNTIDKTHYVFRDKNVIVATGSSGSGIMKADAVGRVVASLQAGKERTELFGNLTIKTGDLGIHKRRVEEEEMVI